MKRAWRTARGAFTALEFIAVDDGEGRLGRSRARNEGVNRAQVAGAEWIFFLDADDVMLPEAFGSVSALVDRYDAIWGLISTRPLAASTHHLRLPQILTMDRIEQLAIFDPFLTLQMGHFVRTTAALATPFDERLDAGEDFDYYLRLWRDFRCTKTGIALFAARQGRRSGGVRGSSAQTWGETVRGRLTEERARLGLQADAPDTIAIKNAVVAELQGFYRSRGLAHADNYPVLAREMPYRGWQTISDYEGEPFAMYCDNDDAACLSLAWTGEYEYVATRIWQQLARRACFICDTTAGAGFYTLLALRAAAAGTAVYCFEPNPARRSRLELNIRSNDASRRVEILISDSARVREAVFRQALDAHKGRSCLIRIAAAGRGDDNFSSEPAMPGPDYLVTSRDADPAMINALSLASAGFRFYELDDAGYRVIPLPYLTLRQGRQYWATRRGSAEIEEITRLAGVTMCADGVEVAGS